MIPSPRIHHYAARAIIFLVMIALITGIPVSYGVAGDDNHASQNLEIRTWYDLDAIRDNLAGNHTLMNDLDSTIVGYDELAGPTANQGKGWQPIGNESVSYATGCGGPGGGIGVRWDGLTGTFDGQGYEIRDLFINRPDEYYVGLFGGVLQDGVIKNISVVNVTVIGKSVVGGLVGKNFGTVSNSYSIGNVTGYSKVGGLMGEDWYATVSNSYSSGSVTGDLEVGGLAGQNVGTVSNSYSTASVTGSDQVGGLVGCNPGLGTVRNSYSTGSVTGNSSVGGLVGKNLGTVSDSFWDLQTSGQPTSSGGTGENTTEMQDIATFSGAGWNITAVALNETNSAYMWNIVNNVTYPFLSWQP